MDTPLIVTDANTLRKAVGAAVEDLLLNKVPDAIREAQKPKWAGKDYVKNHFGWTDRQLTYLRNKGRIEYTQHGRRILYHVPSLEKYIEEGRVKPRSGPIAKQDEK